VTSIFRMADVSHVEFAVYGASCLSSHVGARSNSHDLAGDFLNKHKISGTVAGLKQLRGAAWRVTITGGSAEAVAVCMLSTFFSERFCKLIRCEFFGGGLQGLTKKRVHGPPKRSRITSTFAYSAKPERCEFGLVKSTLCIKLLAPGCLRLGGVQTAVFPLQFPCLALHVTTFTIIPAGR